MWGWGVVPWGSGFTISQEERDAWPLPSEMGTVHRNGERRGRTGSTEAGSHWRRLACLASSVHLFRPPPASPTPSSDPPSISRTLQASRLGFRTPRVHFCCCCYGTLHPNPQPPNSNPQPSALNPQPSTLNPKPSTASQTKHIEKRTSAQDRIKLEQDQCRSGPAWPRDSSRYHPDQPRCVYCFLGFRVSGSGIDVFGSFLF